MKGTFEKGDNVDFIIDFVCDYKGDNVVDFNNKDKADVRCCSISSSTGE